MRKEHETTYTQITMALQFWMYVNNLVRDDEEIKILLHKNDR